MQITKIAVVIAFATLSAGAMADTFTSEGFVKSAPSYTSASSVSRSAVQSQAAQAGSLDIKATEGLMKPTPQIASTRSRDDVRAEASSANRASFAADIQSVEGVI